MKIISTPPRPHNAKPPRRPAWLYAVGTIVEHKGNYFRVDKEWKNYPRRWLRIDSLHAPDVSNAFKPLTPPGGSSGVSRPGKR